MAVDKLVDSTQLDADLTSVANAIRTKGGISAQMAFPNGFVSAVNAIPTGITPTGTKQISITQNGTTTEDVTNYANAEITVDVHGPGFGWPPLLETITLPEDTRAVNIDLSDYTDLDFLIIIEDLTLSVRDWIYWVPNGTEPTGGAYDMVGETRNGLCFIQVKSASTGNLTSATQGNYGVYQTTSRAALTNLYGYAEKATTNMLAGGKFYILGGYYADL